MGFAALCCSAAKEGDSSVHGLLERACPMWPPRSCVLIRLGGRTGARGHKGAALPANAPKINKTGNSQLDQIASDQHYWEGSENPFSRKQVIKSGIDQRNSDRQKIKNKERGNYPQPFIGELPEGSGSKRNKSKPGGNIQITSVMNKREIKSTKCENDHDGMNYFY